MENRAWRIFVCCFLCAGIGTLISLKINHYFWWFGVLVGGFLGYIFYDFKKVITAVPKAWNVAKGCKINWCKICATTKHIMFFYISCFGFSLNFSVSLILFSYFYHGEGRTLQDYSFAMLLSSIPFSLIGLMLLPQSPMPTIEKLRETVAVIRRLNFFWIWFYLLPKIIFWCIKKTPHTFIAAVKGACSGSIILAKFAKCLFIIIHSERRLLCATDSAIGTLVGYLYGNTAIGAMAGGLIGFLNYEIVSKRLLKLVPVNRHK